MYQLFNVTNNGTYDITSLTETIKWGGDIRQAARKLEASLVCSRDYYTPKYTPPLGSLLLLRNSSTNKELIRGVVFDVRKGTDNSMQVISYDHLIYFLKSKGTYIFRGMTADAIIKKLCSDFETPVGNIPSTGIVLQKLILRNMSIYDMCVLALTETSKRNGKKYQMKMQEGALNVIEKGIQAVRWLIAEQSNLISAQYSENINEMKNRVVIMGDKDEVLAEVEDSSLIRQYGVLQELQNEADITVGEAKTIATNILKELGRVAQEASIECLGVDDVEAGTAIEVRESLTGLSGTFYVDTDDHTLSNGQHTMSLKLNWTDEVASIDAPEVEE